MMKKLLTILLLISFAQYLKAQETRNLIPFNSIYVYGNIELELIKSDTNKLEISKVESGTVNSEVKDRNLTISYTMIGDEYRIKAKLYFKDLHEITAKAAVNISSKKSLVFDWVNIRLSKGAKAKLEIIATDFDIVVLQGSKFDLSGKGENGKIYCNAGGICNAKSFKIKDADVRCATMGKATIWVYGNLNASTHTGGKIYYFIEPKTISVRAITGGEIQKR